MTTTTEGSSSPVAAAENATSEQYSTAKEKLEHVWKHTVEKSANSAASTQDPCKWPSYNDVFNDVRKSNYNEMLTCPLDLHTFRKRPKKICAQGIVCCAKMELFDFPPAAKGRPYSGFLTPGTTVEHCLMRFSSALQPMNARGGDNGNKKTNRHMSRMMFGRKLADAKLFPALAMKLFRGGGADVESANLLLLGCKVGQLEDDFFAHCLCTQITSRMPMTLKPILKIFQKYSEHPLALGLSNLCTYDAEGNMCDDLNFPFCLTLKPCYKSTEESSDFLNDLQKIPVGTVLYDIFASPSPLSVSDPSKLQRIGRIVSTSEMKHSVPDDGLFFRHQKKDEDYQLRPHWKADLSTPVVLNDGTKGTAATLVGWELFEQQIKDGGYLDFEAKNTI